MKIEVNLYASLAKYLPKNSEGKPCIMEVGEGANVRQLLEQLKVPSDVVKIIFLNGAHAGTDATLKDGDRLGVFPPVAGG